MAEQYKQRACICQDPGRCRRLANRYAALGDVSRLAYFTIPTEPKPEEDLKVKRKAGPAAKAARTSKLREVILRHLGGKARSRFSDLGATGARKDDLRWSAVHLHPLVLQACPKPGELPFSISSSIAEAVNDKGFSFTDADRFGKGCFINGVADGSYAPAPNFSFDAAEVELSVRERAFLLTSPSAAPSSVSSSASSSVPFSSSSSSSTASASKRQRTSPSEKLAVSVGAEALAARVTLLDQKVEDLLRQLNAEKAGRVQAEDDRDASIAAAHQIAAKEFDDMLVAEGGLSRSTFLSSQWHEAHPNAASHLFGFKSWTETKVYLWALFLVKPPTKARAKGSLGPKAIKRQRRRSSTDMGDFERCLLTKMRIHRG